MCYAEAGHLCIWSTEWCGRLHRHFKLSVPWQKTRRPKTHSPTAQVNGENSFSVCTALRQKKGCPRVGFESTTLCSLGECSTNWATGVVEVRCTLVVFFSVIICKTNVCLFVCSSIEMATVPLWSKSFLALKMSLPLTPGIYTHIIYIHYHVLHQTPWIITSPVGHMHWSRLLNTANFYSYVYIRTLI